MKIFVSGGGTAGHVNPALAIAQVIEKHNENAEICYVGTPHGIENKLVKNYKMFHIDISGIRRSLSPKNIKTAFLVLTSFSKAKKLIKKEKPDAVIGTGGYVCWPICAAAAKLGVPFILHESNSVPGLVVKRLQNKADALLINFEKTAQALDKSAKIHHVGTPLRSEFMSCNRDEERKKLSLGGKYKKLILCFGGSLGADRVNSEILSFMNTYGRQTPDVLIIHATGSRCYKSVCDEAAALGIDKLDNCKIYEYISDMPEKMTAADLVICRSGALTLSELAFTSSPSILIPSPNVTDDQQYKNALVFAEKGAAVIFRESELKGNTISDKVCELLENEKTLDDMKKAASALAVRDSGEKIYAIIEEAIKNKKSGR